MFVQDFLKIAKPLSNLLVEDVKFMFPTCYSKWRS